MSSESAVHCSLIPTSAKQNSPGDDDQASDLFTADLWPQVLASSWRAETWRRRSLPGRRSWTTPGTRRWWWESWISPAPRPSWSWLKSSTGVHHSFHKCSLYCETEKCFIYCDTKVFICCDTRSVYIVQGITRLDINKQKQAKSKMNTAGVKWRL